MRSFFHISGLLAAMMAGQAVAAPLSFLKTQGRDMVDEQGQKVHLRGVGLGHWLLPEAYMWKLGNGADRPRKAEALFERMIGKAKTQAFFKEFYKHYVTEADIARIKALGFNSVRPALNARLLMDEATGQFIEEGFKPIADLVAWCKKHQLYVILDLHGAPGGQTGKNIDDSPHDQPELFTDERFAERCERLWVEMAKRYKDEPVVAAYDLLNEPLPGDFRTLWPKLEPMYKRLTRAIRNVDKKHMIILEGSDWANHWDIFNAPFDSNVTYQFHKYWNEADKASIQGYLDKLDRWQVPGWVGEFGEPRVGLHWMRAVAQLFDEMNLGWSHWPWKKMDTNSSAYSVKMPAGWDKIQAASNNGPLPSAGEAERILWDYLRNIRLENCDYQEACVNALLRRLPGRIEAEDYGHLGEGKSYHLLKESRQSGSFRRDAVPLGPPEGAAREEYNVGWMQAGEWLAFDADCAAAGSYDLSLRMAAEGAGKRFSLLWDGKVVASGEAPATGGWDRFKEIRLNAVNLSKGRHELRFVCDTGGYNLDWIRLVPAGQNPADLKASAIGQPAPVPGLIQAEHFGPKGEGKSYHDDEAANQGGAMRQAEGVDIQKIELGTGLAARLQAGEWLAYEANTVQAKAWALNLRGQGEASVSVFVDKKPAAKLAFGAKWSEQRGATPLLQPGRHNVIVRVEKGQALLDWLELN